MVEDIVVAVAADHFVCGKACDMFGRAIPKSYFSLRIYKIEAVVEMIEEFQIIGLRQKGLLMDTFTETQGSAKHSTN